MNNYQNPNQKSGKMLVGIILLTIGCLLLFNLFRWPLILMVVGVFLGFKKGWHRPAPIILLALGFIFLSMQILPNSMHNMVWPVAIISLGIWLILKPSRPSGKKFQGFEWDKKVDPAAEGDAEFTEPADTSFGDMEDHLDTISIFGGVKKNIVSKNFKGGQIVNIFGGSEINLMQADFTGKIKLDVTQVFGGTKIILPANWRVHSEMAAIFGGIEDKRMAQVTEAQDKILIIEGTSLFGGIDIRSF